MCPDCNHPWGSHQGRNGGQRCVFGYSSEPDCPCKNMNPETEAEDHHAAGVWNAFMGR